MSYISKSNTVSTIRCFIMAAMLTAFVLFFIGQRTVVRGVSMEPALQNGENLILDKISYRFSSPERYDIVVFPGEINDCGEKTLYIKRIIGLPGESVEIKNGAVFINGKLLKSDIYAKDGTTECDTEYNDVTLGENEYYCLGDNRGDSTDSRYIGPILLNRKNFEFHSQNEIMGRIVLKLPVKSLDYKE